MKIYRDEFGYNKQDFLLEINKIRKENKDKWFQWTGRVEGKYMEVKNYGLWLQILRIEGIQHANTCFEKKVSGWLEHISRAIDYNHSFLT